MTFHQCVNLGRFNTEKVVSFVPPDGEFDLMKYRCQEGISLPFRVLPIINEMGRTRMEVGQEACQGWNVAVHLECSMEVQHTSGRCRAGFRATGCSSASWPVIDDVGMHPCRGGGCLPVQSCGCGTVARRE